MPKKITHQRLYNIALYYLSKYDASTGKVRAVLKRRLLRSKMSDEEIPIEAPLWIEDIIVRLVELGYIDDKRYGTNQVRGLSAQGKSTRFISMKLAEAGLDGDLIQELLSTDETDDELVRARRFVQRKKMGYLRLESLRADFYKKDLAALGRAGFSYETASAALKEEEEF